MSQAALALTPPPPRAAAPSAERARTALWFCIRVPGLALKACGLDSSTSGVVFASDKGRAFVYSASAAAQAAGVQAGMPLGQAQTLCEGLQARPRQPRLEQKLLARLATRMICFTPMVSLAPPQALLLEVHASLRLFGGPDNLQAALRAKLAGQEAVIAAAPTPLAASWLAEQNQALVITNPDALRSALGGLALTSLPVAATTQRRLTKLGVRNLRDLWRLPRAGLARRFGPDLLRTLDRALGDAPDPRPVFVPAERFSRCQELPWEIKQMAGLRPAIERLLARLVRFLRARDAAVSRLGLALIHHGQAASRLDIGLRLASRDQRHFMALLETRLEQLRLPAPVVALVLTSGTLQPFVAHCPALALETTAPATAQPWQRLLEQLEARLGAASLQPLVTRADHRPERAWSHSAAAQEVRAGAARPLWLLAAPRPLPSPPTLSSSPERIEGGWWEGRDIRRDYYHAIGADGRRLWVFRNLKGDRRWYLHGLFD